MEENLWELLKIIKNPKTGGGNLWILIRHRKYATENELWKSI